MIIIGVSVFQCERASLDICSRQSNRNRRAENCLEKTLSTAEHFQEMREICFIKHLYSISTQYKFSDLGFQGELGFRSYL